ncbi:MAG: hypothetical protein ACLQU5_25020 [Isosphaeraceae bacterium]
MAELERAGVTHLGVRRAAQRIGLSAPALYCAAARRKVNTLIGHDGRLLFEITSLDRLRIEKAKRRHEHR